MRIFVDVDDTLVRYLVADTPNPYGLYMGTSWEPNEHLIQGLRDHNREFPRDEIIVWSGGGLYYAKMWVEVLGLGDIVSATLTKERGVFILVREGDVVIDDERIPVRIHGPDGWPEVINLVARDR